MKKEYFYYLIVTLAFVTLTTLNACKPEPEPQTPGSVKVTTSSVSNITETSAKCGGTVTASGYSVGACGLCYSELPNPTINSYITSDQVGTGTFTSTMSGLEPGTKYYVRAYATTSSGTLYGEQKEFTTLGDNNGGDDDDDDDNGGGSDGPTTGTINGHEWVDLGLPSGLKWATCNVGASSPEDYGDYYAWGETETKSTYTEETCLTYGVEISNISGNPQYDVARKKWGSTWRMPTKAEYEELLDNCTWTWITQNSVNGCKITGSNGNSIFFPSAGYRFGSSLYNEGRDGFCNFWSSTPNNDDNYDRSAYSFFYGGHEEVSGINRSYGQSVRPVKE